MLRFGLIKTIIFNELFSDRLISPAFCSTYGQKNSQSPDRITRSEPAGSIDPAGLN
jgi:hypothetical protein